MQKRGILLFLVLIASMFLFSFVLAVDDNSTSPVCTDDDGGIVYDKQGNTIGLNINNNYTMLSLTDRCFNATSSVNGNEFTTDNWLLEGYCNGSYAFTIDYLCPYDCVNGACVDALVLNATCTDSDGGKDYYERGTAIGLYFSNNSTITLEDECFTFGGNSNWLLEAYCDGIYAYTIDYQCDYECVNGKCVDEDPQNEDCFDSDGLNYFNKGSVKGMHNGNPNWVYKDSCSGDYVVEGYCEDNEAYTTDYLCAYGCDNGACITTVIGEDLNLTGNNNNSFAEDNWWILILIGLIVIAFIIMFVVIIKRRK